MMSDASTQGPVITCRDLRKIFRQGDVEVPVLLGVDLEVAAEERVASVGEVSVLGQDLSRQNEAERGAMRNKALGFVYQFHHLLPEFSALENVAMPLLIRRQSP